MTDTQTERGSCKFTVQQVEGVKQAIAMIVPFRLGSSQKAAPSTKRKPGDIERSFAD